MVCLHRHLEAANRREREIRRERDLALKAQSDARRECSALRRRLARLERAVARPGAAAEGEGFVDAAGHRRAPRVGAPQPRRDRRQSFEVENIL